MAKRRKRIKRAGAARRRTSVSADDAFSAASQQLMVVRDELVAQRSRFDARIAAVEDLIRDIGGSPAPAAAAARGGGRRSAATTRGGRGVRSGSLKDHLTGILAKGGVMGIPDIEKGVRSAGYKTKNKTLAKSIGIALGQMSNVKRVSRGQYRIK